MNFDWKNLDWKRVAYIAGGFVAVLLVVWLIARLLGGGSASPAGTQGGTFGSGGNISGGTTGTSGGTTATTQGSTNAAQAKIFKIADGPIVGATFIESRSPTTTVVRYVTGNDGHVLDYELTPQPGNSPQPVSNTTIPAIDEVLWTEQGRGAIYRYLDQGVVKTLHLALSPARTSLSTSTAPTPVAFASLPDGITGIAPSPDGSRIAYLLASGSGSTGYVARPDGSSPSKLFSLPLSQVVVGWPATTTLFLYQKSAAGVPGIAFSVDTRTGGVSQVLYGLGLTTNVDPLFSNILYQTNDGTAITDYVTSTKGSSSEPLSDIVSAPPFPEQCAWTLKEQLAYCAAPAVHVAADFLDSYHRGEASVPDTIVEISSNQNVTLPVATPGSRDGGESSDIVNLAVSPSGNYLLFINKNDRSLWGVRLFDTAPQQTLSR